MLASAVRRGLKTPLLIGDLPFGSYERSNEQAIRERPALRQGGRLRRGQARTRRRLGRARAGDHQLRHPRDGPRRPHPPDRVGAGRLQGPGPHRRGRGKAGRGDAGAAVDRLLRGRLRGDPGRRHRGADAPPGGAGDRHRRRPRHRRPGAGLPRPARHLRGAHPALRAPLRRGPRGDGQGRQRVHRATFAPAPSPTRSTPTRSTRRSWRSSSATWRTRAWPGPTPPGTGRRYAPPGAGAGEPAFSSLARARARSLEIFTAAEVSGAARIRPMPPNRAPPAMVTIRTASGWMPRVAP